MTTSYVLSRRVGVIATHTTSLEFDTYFEALSGLIDHVAASGGSLVPRQFNQDSSVEGEWAFDPTEGRVELIRIHRRTL